MGYRDIVVGRPRTTPGYSLARRTDDLGAFRKSEDLNDGSRYNPDRSVGRALLYATHVHGGQVRKQTTIPYIAHLLAVAATVLEYGGSEDMAVAALLHDAVEDQGGEPRLVDIRHRFGDRVAVIVRSCSDSFVNTAAGEQKCCRPQKMRFARA